MPQRRALCQATQGVSSITSSGTTGSASLGSIDYDLLMDTVATNCPLGGVVEVMRSTARGILTCSPDETLESIVPRLTKVSGMPVISEGLVVGVISRRDIIRARRANESLSALKVSDKMTAPAITVNVAATVEEAAALMLKHKIRRLPVVDDTGVPVGLLARSDIFKPLFLDQYEAFMRREVAALQGEQKVKKPKKITWAIKYLYDGDCPVCQTLQSILERRDGGKGRIKFVNIASPSYNPAKNMGIEYEDAMETIHAIRPDGQVLYGTDALRALFGEVGLGWAADLSAMPGFSQVMDASYNFISANRIGLGGSLGGLVDALQAAKRMDMSRKGVETCQDLDDECTVEW